MQNMFKLAPLTACVLLAAACMTPNDDHGTGGGGGAGAGGGAGGGSVADRVPVDATGTTETATQNLRSNVEELDASLRFLTDSDLLPELLAFGPRGESAEESGQVGPEDGPGGNDDGDDEPIVVEVRLDEPLDDLIEGLRERVMVEADIEDDGDANTVIYRLDPDRVCRDLDDDRAEGVVTPGEDGPGEDREDHDGDDDGDAEAECRRQLTETPVRVRVTSYAEGDVDLALLIGEERLEVLFVQIHRDLLAAQLDLGATRQAIELLGDDEADADLPDVVEGVVRIELRRNGPADFTGTLSILQDIRIEHQDGDKEISVRIGETPALVSVRLDGAAKVITAQLGIGEVEVAMPWQQIVDALYSSDAGGGCAGAMGHDGEPAGEVECWEDEPEEAPQVDGTFEAFLAGLTGRTSFSGDEDRLELTDLTLGAETSTVKVDDDTLIAVDLNKDAGRKAAVSVQEVRNGNLRIEVVPELDVAVAFALRHVQDVFDDIPSFMLDETLGVRLDGAATPALETVGDESRQLRVADGELTLWSTAMDDDVIITEGMCVAGPDDDDEPVEGAHPVFGGIEALQCGF